MSRHLCLYDPLVTIGLIELISGLEQDNRNVNDVLAVNREGTCKNNVLGRLGLRLKRGVKKKEKRRKKSCTQGSWKPFN